MYYEFVTRDLENCARVFHEWLGSYPHDNVALGNLGGIYEELGQLQQGAELTREGMKGTPDDVIGYNNLARLLLFLNQFEESRKTIQDAFDRKLDSEALHNYLYQLAFHAGDVHGMAEQWHGLRASLRPPRIFSHCKRRLRLISDIFKRREN